MIDFIKAVVVVMAILFGNAWFDEKMDAAYWSGFGDGMDEQVEIVQAVKKPVSWRCVFEE